MAITTRLIPVILMACGQSACTAVDMSTFPSLARRPIEQRADVAPASAPSAPAPELVSATLTEAIRALARDADAGDAAFQASLGANRAMISAGRGALGGSEAWARAEMAYSRLEAAHGPTVFALAELDRLAIDAGAAGHEASAVLIAREQARVAALVEAQIQILRALQR
ncbi:MAG: hypothetical protein ABL909_02540 [Sphingopyxis sp.]